MKPARIVVCLILIPTLLAASNQTEEDVFYSIVLAPILAPYWTVYGIHWLVTLPHPLLGKWESRQGLPDGSIESLEFHGWPDSFLERKTVRIRRGRFRIEQERLYLADDSLPASPANEEVFSISVRRASMVLRDQTGRRLFRQGGPGDDSQPILGRWTDFVPAGFGLDLRLDGTFELEDTRREAGSFKTTKEELKVQFRESGVIREEEWRVRTAHGHLFLTHNGNTVEYQQQPRK
ncbi:MAG TPA: hypothetical protein VN841_14165 [Bryobacteraceae bacterium]|nr:hypothetical protein [Bryobacteraceae bacterium]